ncbi:hypothetical protein J6590_043598 [Homalodisca vitripennis]|nr:hypothetical protein J6590_043598 [Homalodisca vitripennis]
MNLNLKSILQQYRLHRLEVDIRKLVVAKTSGGIIEQPPAPDTTGAVLISVAGDCLLGIHFIHFAITDVHQYGTRGRDNLRLHPHRTAAFKRLPSEVSVKLINKLPDEIKNFNEPKKLKLD